MKNREDDIYIEIEFKHYLCYMRMTIISHLVKDSIIDKTGSVTFSIGGPPCYCGLTARKFGLDVLLITKFGKDFPYQDLNFLKNKGIQIKESAKSNSLTTRFELTVKGFSRNLSLKSRCEPITKMDLDKVSTDGWIVSPVFNEISMELLQDITSRKNDEFIMLDPQGFTRRINSKGIVSVKKRLNDFKINKINAIKIDREELVCLSNGLTDIQGMKKIQSQYSINFIIYTENRVIHLIDKNKHYWCEMRRIESPDSTGLGDIMSSAFTSSYLKEGDVVWAFCCGIGTAIAALKTKKTGINKIPEYKEIRQNSADIYNKIQYEQL
ncbi:MAG: hypothetical protein DA328_05830 [Nitrososphaeraceae archaeon]|nr:hypothetical protein [Nitrososphaeraceae archaeon]